MAFEHVLVKSLEDTVKADGRDWKVIQFWGHSVSEPRGQPASKCVASQEQAAPADPQLGPLVLTSQSPPGGAAGEGGWE